MLAHTRLVSLALLTIGLAGCARTARLASTWRDPGAPQASLARLLVVAVGRTPGERRAFEDRFAAELRARGMDALPSYPLIGDGRVDSALVDAQRHRAGCDGIFVSRVVDRQVVRQYYDGGNGRAGYYGHGAYYGPPSAYHRGWWPYYSLGFASVASLGYAEDQVISVETNLYRHADGLLVWSGLSRQWLGSLQSVGDATPGVVRELVAELARSGVVRSEAGSRSGESGTSERTRSPR